MVQAYCVKCRAKRDIKDPKEVKHKDGDTKNDKVYQPQGLRGSMRVLQETKYRFIMNSMKDVFAYEFEQCVDKLQVRFY
jgi:hypothetical protein